MAKEDGKAAKGHNVTLMKGITHMIKNVDMVYFNGQVETVTKVNIIAMKEMDMVK